MSHQRDGTARPFLSGLPRMTDSVCTHCTTRCTMRHVQRANIHHLKHQSCACDSPICMRVLRPGPSEIHVCHRQEEAANKKYRLVCATFTTLFWPAPARPAHARPAHARPVPARPAPARPVPLGQLTPHLDVSRAGHYHGATRGRAIRAGALALGRHAATRATVAHRYDAAVTTTLPLLKFVAAAAQVRRRRRRRPWRCRR